MTQALRWVPIHSGVWKEKVIAVAGTDASGSLQVLFPLYDSRDRNFDGTSIGEKISSLITHGFSRQAMEAEILWTAAVDLVDPMAWSNAQQSLYRAAFKYVIAQLDKQYVTGLISGSVGTLVKTAILARGAGPIVGYFLKLGAEKAVDSVLDSLKKKSASGA